MSKTSKTYQKLFQATMATTMATGAVIAAVPATTNAQALTDLDAKQDYYTDVLELTKRGIVKGFPDGTYKPNEAVTRGQAAKIIAGALGLDTKNVKDPGFTDVKKTDEYYGAIAALAEAGIITGYPDKTFKQAQTLNRSQMAKIVTKGFKLQEEPLTDKRFTDVKVDAPYAKYVQTLLTNGITKGTTATTFAPFDSVKRGQLASFIVRSEQAVKQQTAEVLKVTADSIELSSGTYTLPVAAQELLHPRNANALKGAKLTYTAKDQQIEAIQLLTLHADGTESAPILLDGNNSTFAGNIHVNADFVEMKNVTIQGDVEFGTSVKTRFIGENVTIEGKTIVTDQQTMAVATNFIAPVHQGALIRFINSELRKVDLAKEVKFELKGTSRVNFITLLANSRLIADEGVTVADVVIEKDATEVTLDAIISTLRVLAKKNSAIFGSGKIDKIVIESGEEVDLQLDNRVGEVAVKDNGARLAVGGNAVIGNITLPSGKKLEDVIRNYEQVKEKIEQVGGQKNPDAKPVTPPSSGGGTTQPPAPKGFELSIMHFNDTHAHLDNVAKRVTAVKEHRAAKPDALLLDAGDVFSGTLYFNEFKGQSDLEFMNLMKVDAMTFGNHEFDLGSSEEGHQALVDFIQAAQFPFVSSNVDFSKDDKFTGLFNTKISSSPENSNIYTGIVKEVKGEKVGIFGLTTEATKNSSSPGAITFSNYIEEAKKMVAEFEKMGVNKIVAITHLGFDDNAAIDNDMELAKAVDGIDVIVGGHTHTTLAEPVVVDANKVEPTIIVQAGQYGDYLGTLDVTFNGKGVVTKHNGKLIKIADKAEDEEAAALLETYAAKIEELQNEEIGATAAVVLENPRTGGDNTKPSVRKNETALGNLITDGMLAKAKTIEADVIMALQNGGGIRQAINEGPITAGEVISVLPFGNTLALMDVTGAELKEAFEISVDAYPGEKGGFLHVSGAQITFDSSKPVGERIVSVKYKDGDTFVEIEDDKTYTIATNAFTAIGGDGYDVFKKAYAEGRVNDLGLSDWENFADHLKSLGTVHPKVEGRIVDIASTTPGTELPGGNVNAADFSGTVDAPKVYSGDVTVSVTDIAKFEHVVVKGNLTLTGTPAADVTFTNIQVEGNLDLTELDADVFGFDGIEVSGETIV